MNLNNSTYLQDFLIFVLIASIVISGTLAMTAMPALAIGLGFVLGIAIPRLIFNKKWNNKEFNELPAWKRYIVAAVPALVGCQFGWAALLV